MCFVSGIQDLEALKEEAAERKFPDNELLQRLNSVLRTVQECQTSSTELQNNTQSKYGTGHLRMQHTQTHLVQH